MATEPETDKSRERWKRSKHGASSSAAQVASSEDLLKQILLRLPAKPLHKFKSVSKQWYSIISTPKFTVTYSRRNPNPQLGFLLNAQTDFRPNAHHLFVSLGGYQYGRDPSFIKIPNLEIHHVCNGLLCYSKPHVGAPQFASYYVCNHASGQSKRIRVLGRPCIQRLKAVNLAFDPLKSPHYKIIFVSEVSGSESSHLIKIDIYSSETESWRPAKKGIYIVPYDIGFYNAVYWNDAIYWYHQTKKTLTYFEFEEDSLEKLPMPQVSELMNYYYFGESGGHLHLVGSWIRRTSFFTVFEMQKDRSGWFLKYDGEFHALPIAFPKMVLDKRYRLCVFSLVNLIRGEQEGELILVLAIPGGLVQYNVQGKTSKLLYSLPLKEDALKHLTFNAQQYMETLVPV